jgi:hypothetical protein
MSIQHVEPAIEAIINNHTDVFELQILGCVSQLPQMYYKYRDIIGKFDSRYGECNEFSAEVDNEIYMAVAKYYDALSASAEDVNKIQPCKWDWVKLIIQGKVNQNKLNPDVMANAALRFKAATNQPAKNFQSIVDKGIQYWLAQKRSRRGVAPLMGDMRKNVDDIKAAIAQVETSVQSLGERQSTGLMDGLISAADDHKYSGDIIPFPLPTLNNALEGGITKTEIILGVAPQNGGKTVWATMCGRFWAEMKYNVLFISTEELVTRIVPRIVSSGMDIDYKLIARGIREMNFDKDQWDKIVEYIKMLETQMRFQFHKTEGTGIADLLPGIIETEIENGFTPDILILDWLGGGLGERAKNDRDTMTQFYKESAAKLKTVALDYNLMLMTMAQAGMSKSKDQKLIDAQMIDNCTGLAERFDFGIGISALQETNVDRSVQNRATFKETQYINPFKVRYAQGGAVPVLRRFGTQKFLDVQAQAPTQPDDGHQVRRA